MDITFGYSNDIKQKNVYGGILIRSIKNFDSKEIIGDPCKVVNKILEINGAITINDFVNTNNDNNVIPLKINQKKFITKCRQK